MVAWRHGLRLGVRYRASYNYNFISGQCPCLEKRRTQRFPGREVIQGVDLGQGAGIGRALEH